MSASLTLIYPDDFHVHLRDGLALNTTVAATARCFKRALIMPNLLPAISSIAAALDYRQRLLDHLPANSEFQPLMSLYLTDDTPVHLIDQAKTSHCIKAVKLYPSGATTNSHAGVTAIEKVMPVLERMAELQLPLLLHGEVTDPAVDVFDREAVFLDNVLEPLRRALPELPIVLEHITTLEAVDYCRAQTGRFAATITVHHLLYNRNALLGNGLRPHLFCLPILKRQRHQQALRCAATSGDPRFFLGTDSAPHELRTKESACGCAGIFSAPVAMELYAQVFEEEGALHHLEAFASRHGADFYQLPYNSSTLALKRDPWIVPDSLPYLGGQIIPLAAGQQLSWKINND